MARRIRTTAVLLKEAFERCHKHNTPILAAGLAFYTLLSLAPALWIVVAAAGVFIGRQSARGQVITWATEMLGPGGARFIGGVLDQASASSSLATVAGVVSMFFGATIAFGGLQDAFNLVWDLPPSEHGYIKRFFIKRLLSFITVLAVGVLLLASLLISTAISAAGRFVPQSLPVTEFLLQSVNFALSLALVTILFAVVYRILPDTSVAWHDVWTGAGVTALLFSIGKTLIGLYLGHTGFSSAYGAAGSLVVVLLWVYYSAQIFLFGAEFTEVYAQARRS